MDLIFKDVPHEVRIAGNTYLIWSDEKIRTSEKRTSPKKTYLNPKIRPLSKPKISAPQARFFLN